MIMLYTGTPGSGKSLHAAYDLIDALQDGKDVIGNFPIDKSYFRHKTNGRFFYWQNGNMSPDRLKLFSATRMIPFKEHQALLIIDECGILFNSRAWKDSDRMSWLTFFSQHRKLGYDVLLIAQMDKQLDKQILGNVEEEHKHRNVKNYKWFGKFLSAISGGLFLDICYWYPARLKLSSSFFRFHPRKATIYDTFKIFD